MRCLNCRPLFQLGRLYVTSGVLEAIEGDHTKLVSFLFRHLSGDWGDLCDEDKAQNEYALEIGGRIFSAYVMGELRVWVITEAEGLAGRREATTVLLPQEY